MHGSADATTNPGALAAGLYSEYGERGARQ
jgi:hypothetical protein